MGGRELDFNITINENNLQNYLEHNNSSYRQARRLFNTLVNNDTNPLADHGLSGNKLSFIILLLEKVIRNTNLIFDQNLILEGKVLNLEKEIFEIKQQGLEPIIQAGNKITENLKTFEQGFNNWDNKFTNYSETFTTWDLGFKNFETNFKKLDQKFENYSTSFNTWDSGFKIFEEKISKIEKALTDFSTSWTFNISKILSDLNKIEGIISQSNNEIIEINSKIKNLEDDFYNLQSKPPSAPPTNNTASTSSHKQIFQVIPSHQHNFEF